MSEREGTPADFQRLAAQLRGQKAPSEQGVNLEPVESVHPEPEPDLREPDALVARLLATKAGHAELVRLLHPDDAEPAPTERPDEKLDYDGGARGES
jgi:hypothetical protein